MDKIVKSCGGLLHEHSISDVLKNLSYDKEQYKLLKYYDITGDNKNRKKKNVFLMAGEHPRELVSVETMLNFVKDLCENREAASRFRIIVNANPYGRQLVEKGDYCNRANLNKVDLNRNWGYNWGKDIVLKEEHPGSKAFSEIETQFILNSLKNFNAFIFLTVHSGVYGLFHPYAYDTKDCEINKENMKAVLQSVKEKFCSVCLLGAPSTLIGYKSSGTCVDYAYKVLNIPYSFAWEIYTNEMELPEMKQIATHRFSQTRKKSSLLKNNMLRSREDDNQECFNLFNPTNKIGVDWVTSNWTKAINHLLVSILKRR